MKTIARVSIAMFLVACGGSGSSVGGGGTSPPAASAPADPPGTPPAESIGASGCPTGDVVHFEKNGTELALAHLLSGSDPSKSPPSEPQSNVADFEVTSGGDPAAGYEEALVYLYLDQGTDALDKDTSFEYRRYPPLPPGQSGVAPADAASFSGARLAGTVTVTTPTPVKDGDPICGRFDLTGTAPGEPSIRLHGVFRHQFIDESKNPGGG